MKAAGEQLVPVMRSTPTADRILLVLSIRHFSFLSARLTPGGLLIVNVVTAYFG
jgi:hypothetical protein